MSHVLIAGCGYVGAVLAGSLAQAGHRVWGLRRSPPDAGQPWETIRADLTRPETLAGLPEPLDSVFYLAAADCYDDEAYRLAYVQGLQNLLERLEGRSTRPTRVYFASSTRLFDQADGSWVDESSPTEPSGFAGRRVLEGETVLRGSTIPGTAVRFGGLYGPGRTRFIETVRRGDGYRNADGPSWTNRIHRDDAAGFLRHLMGLPDPAPVYVGVDSEPADRAEIFRWLGRRLGVELADQADTDSAGLLTPGRRCRNARLLATGYALRYPTFREGYAALLDAGE